MVLMAGVRILMAFIDTDSNCVQPIHTAVFMRYRVENPKTSKFVDAAEQSHFGIG